MHRLTTASDQAVNVKPSTQISSANIEGLGVIQMGQIQGQLVMAVTSEQGVCMSFEVGKMQATEFNLFGISVCQKYVLKTQLKAHPQKKNDVLAEAEILRHLTEQECVSAPKLYWAGEVSSEIVKTFLAASNYPVNHLSETIQVSVQEFVKDSETTTMADVLCAIMEQKSLGVFHGDLKPDNIRCCPERNITFLIDYDQATLIDEETQNLNGLDYMKWCNTYARERFKDFNFQSAFHYFPEVVFETHIEPYFVQGVFNVGETTLFKNQETTMNPHKIYHTWDTPHVFAQGERGLDERIPWLDEVEFDAGETVLDVGCNAGLLSRYLHHRGCAVTGIDIDPNVISGAKILANMHNQKTDFYHVDLDQQPILGQFDTVMLFSVIHHTANIYANCLKVARSAKRILIECRFNEGGAKPLFNGQWVSTTSWRYRNIESMTQGLEKLFPGFKMKQVFGPGDRDRYLLELIKSAS